MLKNDSFVQSSKEDQYPYVNKYIVLLACGYVIIWYLQIGHRIPFLGSIRFEMIYALCLSVIAVILPIKIDFHNPLTKWIILFFIVTVIQVPLSYNVQFSWYIFVDRVVKFAFMAFFIIAFFQKPKHLFWFLSAFMLACMKMGQEGFLGQLTGSLVWQNQGVMRLHGPTPLYLHPNSFTGMALGTVPFLLYFFPIVNKYIKLMLILQMIFALNIILFTGSRTGYVAFLGMLFVILLKSKNKLKILLILFIVGLIAIPNIPQEYQERFDSIFSGQDKEGASTTKRIEILKDATEVFLKYPYGIGVGAFPSIRSDLYGRTQDTHNLYLEVLTNLGIQGFIVFILLIYKMLKLLVMIKNSFNEKLVELKEISLDNNKKSPQILELKILIATADSVILFIFVRLLLGLFGMDLYEIYWWFAIGITVSLYNIKKSINIKSFSNSN